MIELLLPYGFDTLEYSRVKATISICTLVDYSMAKKCQYPRIVKRMGTTWGISDDVCYMYIVFFCRYANHDCI
jgi:hypothetical protein